MRTHRLLAAAGAAALTLLLSACNAEGTSGGPETGSGKGAVAWSFPSQDVAVWADQLVFMESIVEDAGYEFLTHDPGFDAQKQINDWQAWITRGDVKAMGGFPLDANLVTGVMTEAETAGIPMIGYIIEWPGVKASTLTPAYEGGVELGKRAGEWIVENYGSESVGVAILGDFGNPYGQEQARGYHDGLAETEAKVTVAELQTLDRNEGHSNMQSQLTADPDTRVVLSAGADMGLGARQAIIDSGVAADDPEWFVGATDSTDEVLDLIGTGDDIWRTAFVSKTSELAEANAKLLIDAAEGKPVQTTTVPATEVTADNLEEFRSPK